MRILIADDHPVVRKGLRQILEENFEDLTTAEAATGADILKEVLEQKFDLVLLDLSMPGGSGLEIMKELKRRRSSLKFLILSMYPEEEYALTAIRAGASGYLTKSSAPEELVNAVKKICSGGVYVTHRLAELLASDLEQRDEVRQNPHERLSHREYQVLCMIASGKSIKQIAEELNINARTASTYRGRILEKMSMKTNADLIRYAMKYLLVP